MQTVNNFDEYARPLISPRSLQRDSGLIKYGSPRLSHWAQFAYGQSSEGKESSGKKSKSKK